MGRQPFRIQWSKALARVTVEDCIEKIQNRFDLILIAAQRARGISSGDPLTVDRDRDKNPVVALREIADETVDIDEIDEELVSSLQRMKRREEEQAARDEAASSAQAEMSDTAGMLDATAEAAGMQVVKGSELDSQDTPPDGEGPFSKEESIADEGSFSDEAVDDEDIADEGDG